MSSKSDGRQGLPSPELHTVKSRTSRDFPEEILGDEQEYERERIPESRDSYERQQRHIITITK